MNDLMRGRALPISACNWRDLVQANERAMQAGWASRGVFGPAIGPEYAAGSQRNLLYVGKSAGPLGDAVGVGFDREASIAASTKWMIERKNKSAFWQFVDQLDPTRRSIAWTNVCKINTVDGRPPSGERWAAIAETCMAALADEIDVLAPALVIFAISDQYRTEVHHLLSARGYQRQNLEFHDRWTELFATAGLAFAMLTKHPQGWTRDQRDVIVRMAAKLMTREAERA